MRAKRTPRLRLHKEADDQFCNLCLLRSKLTYDHVPTKGWGNKGNITVRRFRDHTFLEEQSPRIVQGGLGFRTLCSDCNSNILGSVDGALADLVKVCRREFEREHRVFKAKLRPNAILRSILGHMVAVRPYTEKDMSLDKMIRDYLVSGKALDPAVSVYVWPYLIPNDLVIVRDFLLGNAQTGKHSGILNVIKFYPLTAVVQVDGDVFDAPAFQMFAGLAPADVIEMPLSFVSQFDPKYPEEAEKVDPKYMVIGGRGMTDGVERDTKVM